MSIVPTSSKVPVVPVAAGAVVAQLGAAAIGLLLPFPALLAIVLTAGAARVATRGRVGPVVARTGLAVGAVAAPGIRDAPEATPNPRSTEQPHG